MTDRIMECQFHGLCGDYCETAEQRAAGLCENCLDAEAMRQRRKERQAAELAELHEKVEAQALEIERLRALLRERS